ncbi:MAG: hypothetical protein HFJ38_04455 [Bacilli bacterium]|nr:hypothetical protein [Bacilli bacterium]
MYNPVYRKIEHYLYNYEYIDIQIEKLKADITNSEYNQNYTRYIKNKSSSLEDLVIKNIETERRILKIKKWKKLINKVLTHYKNSNNINYKFIILKYLRRLNYIDIEYKLNLSFKEQKDIQNAILEYIFFVAIKNNMLAKEVSFIE